MKFKFYTETVDKLQNWFFAFLYLVCGGLVGVLVWGHEAEIWRLGLLLFLPVVWGMSNTRMSGTMLMFGYYLMGARGLPGGAGVFFGDNAPWWMGWGLWFGACILLTVPFWLFWIEDRGFRAWRFVVALCVSAVPPLGLIGWISPLSMGGVVFPGMGWVGIGLVLWLYWGLVCGIWRLALGMLGIAIIANLIAMERVIHLPSHWQGVDTHFPRLSSGGADDAGQLLAAMQRVEWVKQFAESVPADSVRILPETVLGSYDALTEVNLSSVNHDLAARRSRILVGTELPAADGRYENAVLVLGASNNDNRAASQSVPVPVSMWKPWSSTGAIANVWGHGGVITVQGLRAGVLICYEQLLAFSILWMMVEKPTVLVAVSNVWWARDTSIPAIQGQMMLAFGRLFGVGVIGAKNG